MTILEIAKWLQEYGVYGFLLVTLYGGWKKWWVFGWLYKEKALECEEWKAALLRNLNVSEKLADKVVPK